jgi:hypothetical protein
MNGAALEHTRHSNAASCRATTANVAGGGPTLSAACAFFSTPRRPVAPASASWRGEIPAPASSPPSAQFLIPFPSRSLSSVKSVVPRPHRPPDPRDPRLAPNRPAQTPPTPVEPPLRLTERRWPKAGGAVPAVTPPLGRLPRPVVPSPHARAHLPPPRHHTGPLSGSSMLASPPSDRMRVTQSTAIKSNQPAPPPSGLAPTPTGEKQDPPLNVIYRCDPAPSITQRPARRPCRGAACCARTNHPGAPVVSFTAIDRMRFPRKVHPSIKPSQAIAAGPRSRRLGRVNRNAPADV